MPDLIKKAKDEVIKTRKKVSEDYHRLNYHLMSPVGLINDPNGFSYFKGKYHLFYQWNPFDTGHSSKYWGHFASEDLANWEDFGPALAPSERYEKNGCYSGSGIEINEKLHLFYTGNVKDEEGNRETYQCLAVSKDGFEFEKLGPILENQPEGYTRHFRDPKVWKHGEKYYAVIGAQRENMTGAVVLYSFVDPEKWEFEGEIKTEFQDFGYMWECPDYFEIDKQGVFVFSPQGIDPSGDSYNNIYQSGYVIGNLNLDTLELEHGGFYELDRGFDFYAPQTMSDDRGRRIMVAWVGLPDVEYPTDNRGWAHCLSLPRELSLKRGKLIQKPVPELSKLRKELVEVEDKLSGSRIYPGVSGDSFEMSCSVKNIGAKEFGINLRVGKGQATVVKYNAVDKKIILDRSSSGELYDVEHGTVRKCSFDSDEINFHIFMDRSLVEIFINDGEEVFTARIFPDKESKGVEFFSDGDIKLNVKKWDI
jgi:beta-fructofuranosidase